MNDDQLQFKPVSIFFKKKTPEDKLKGYIFILRE